MILENWSVRSRRALRAALRVCFWLAVVLFVAAGTRLAATNTSEGGWDAASNLIAARNVANGRGFTTTQVQDFVEAHRIPERETVRAPGVIYLIAGVFRVAGVSLAAVVWLNVLTVLVAVLCLRAAVAIIAPGWLADTAGLLLIANAADYQLVPLVNNDASTAVICIALLVVALVRVHRLRGLRLAIVCGVVGAAAFLVKQSYILGFAAFATVLLLSERRYRWPVRISHAALAGFLMALLSAPYWLPNLREHGTPLYSPIQKLRLPYRYGLIPMDTYQRAVFIGKSVPGYRDIARRIGWGNMLRHDLDLVRMIPGALFGRGALVIVGAVVLLVFVRGRRWWLVGAAATLSIPAFFDAVWWAPEPRYFFPVFPIAIFIGVLGILDYRLVERRYLHPAVARRFRRAFAIVIAFVTLGTLLETRWGWRSEFAMARTPEPAWVGAVDSIPPAAVVLTTVPPQVTWWTSRPTVLEPMGTRQDLDTVLALYHPSYYLDLTPGPRANRPPFASGELDALGSGDGWALYRINGTADDAPNRQ